jgi:GntR family transcriptional regulator, transcriptional repressor for pyruvate dehydrogenase complex
LIKSIGRCYGGHVEGGSLNGPSGALSLRLIEQRGSVRAVVEQIAQVIQSGELRFGDRLPPERTLAEQLSVSRVTVRKACHVLAEAGVLETRSGMGRSSGTVVRSELVPRGLLPGPHSIPFAEIWGVLEARRLLEPRVAQLAGLRATADDHRELERILELQRRAVDDTEQVRLLDPSFHLAIARATHNPTVVALMQGMLHRLELTRNVPIEPGEAQRTIAVHERTLAAILERDPRAIDVAMDEHLAIMEETWRAVSGRTLPPGLPEFLHP